MVGHLPSEAISSAVVGLGPTLEVTGCCEVVMMTAPQGLRPGAQAPLPPEPLGLVSHPTPRLPTAPITNGSPSDQLQVTWAVG